MLSTLSSLPKATLTRPLTRALSTSRPASMPLYLCYCPDYPDNVDARLKVREAHLAEATKDKESGASVFGRAYLSDELATHQPGKPAADQIPGMAGSVMVLRFPTLEACWERIKADKYWTGGVWDKEKLRVHEIIGAPVDETIKIQ
ncbi:Aspercryptin biosynthesis cluster protein B [Vanrija pseudolonga]|uniref:Aspercryptin biosynthesis cluster protein B n=1 Tax=Vanrija pseudolonga TaxID=143232 RepID=A0AAF0Y6E1_9TREE|nr:Aspercryptin biosynthesis cluster protein B [Vanrija pseudolonga]